MTDNFVDPKTVLGNAKNETCWKYFKLIKEKVIIGG